MFQVKADDGLLFPRLQPEITGNPTVVFIDAPVAASPVVELAGLEEQTYHLSPLNLWGLRPVVAARREIIPNVSTRQHLSTACRVAFPLSSYKRVSLPKRVTTWLRTAAPKSRLRRELHVRFL